MAVVFLARTAAGFDHGERELVGAMTEAVGAGRVSIDPADRMAYSRDLWPRTLLAVRAGEPSPFPPDCVVWPTTREEVSRVIARAAELGVPIVPYGAGSGVCGGAAPTQGGVVLDLKRMDRVLALDEMDP